MPAEPQQRRKRPVRQPLLDLNRQAVAPLFCGIDRRYAVLQYDMMRLFGEAKSRHPAAMHLGPCRAMIVMSVPEQKAGELLAGMAQAAHGRQPGPYQVAHRLVGTVRDPY